MPTPKKEHWEKQMAHKKSTRNINKNMTDPLENTTHAIHTKENQEATQLLLYAQDHAYPEKYTTSDATRIPEFI